MSEPLRRALAVLEADAFDPERAAMWRYGVRHCLTVIRDALDAEIEADARKPLLDLLAAVYDFCASDIEAYGGPALAEQVRDVLAVEKRIVP